MCANEVFCRIALKQRRKKKKLPKIVQQAKEYMEGVKKKGPLLCSVNSLAHSFFGRFWVELPPPLNKSHDEREKKRAGNCEALLFLNR